VDKTGPCSYCRGTGRTSIEKNGYKIVVMRGKCTGYFCSLPDSFRGGKPPGKRVIYKSMFCAKRGCWDCVQGGTRQD
jgi:hypothetical protein